MCLKTTDYNILLLSHTKIEVFPSCWYEVASTVFRTTFKNSFLKQNESARTITRDPTTTHTIEIDFKLLPATESL